MSNNIVTTKFKYSHKPVRQTLMALSSTQNYMRRSSRLGRV